MKTAKQLYMDHVEVGMSYYRDGQISDRQLTQIHREAAIGAIQEALDISRMNISLQRGSGGIVHVIEGEDSMSKFYTHPKPNTISLVDIMKPYSDKVHSDVAKEAMRASDPRCDDGIEYDCMCDKMCGISFKKL